MYSSCSYDVKKQYSGKPNRIVTKTYIFALGKMYKLVGENDSNFYIELIIFSYKWWGDEQIKSQLETRKFLFDKNSGSQRNT